MVAEIVVGQRWELRLQTHRYMLTRFPVVSQSEYPRNAVVGSLVGNGFSADVAGSVRLEH